MNKTSATIVPKIEMVNRYFYPVSAGIETCLVNISKNISKKCRLTIHTSQSTLTERNILKEKERLFGSVIKRYPYNFLGFFPKISYSEADVLVLNNFDILPHSYVLLYSLILKILGKKNFLLKISTHGGLNPSWSTFHPLQAFIKRNYHKSLGVWLINNVCDGVHTVSEWETGEIVKMGVNSKLITSIPNGIDDEAFINVEKRASEKIRSSVKRYGRYIIQLGRIHPIKNYQTTIKALVDIPDLKFVIAGPIHDQKYKIFLDKLITKFNLQDRVIFTGVIKGIDKYYLIKHAQMMVHMALWESYPLAICEGLSQGLVCIVARNTALPYLVKDKINGYVLPTFDSSALSEKINFVLSNKKNPMIKKIEKNNARIFSKKSWKAVSDKLFEFYTKIL